MRRLVRWPVRAWRSLGPGLITGAADDDPSGIATYSIAGAQFGLAFLWTALLTWPLMAGVQIMCARIGMVTGRGLMAAMRTRFPRWVLVCAAVALLIANTLNVGADLAGMSDAAELLTGLNSHGWVFVFGAGLAFGTLQLHYLTVARVLRWLALVLFGYVVTGIILRPDWGTVIRAALTPSVPGGREGWATLVAILGTTISPYLFFWQASQEVEEEKARGRYTLRQRRGATREEIRTRNLDVGAGTFLSNLVMFFIVLTTALTLHRHGLTTLQTSRDVAVALEPFAGRFAMLLYTVGLVGTGLLAIPTLTGSAAYAFADTFGWRQGIDRRPHQAPGFYLVVGLATLAGITIDFANLNPVRALFWTAVLNGMLAPVLLFAILLVASDSKTMQGQPLALLPRVVVAVAAVVMTGAALALVVL